MSKVSLAAGRCQQGARWVSRISITHPSAPRGNRKVCTDMNPPKTTDAHTSVTYRGDRLLWAVGFVICLLAAIDSLGSLPFPMPASWYNSREIWIGLGVLAMVAGFLIGRPQKGDEYDTT